MTASWVIVCICMHCNKCEEVKTNEHSILFAVTNFPELMLHLSLLPYIFSFFPHLSTMSL